MATANGQIFPFGDAKPYGGTEDRSSTTGIVAMVAMNSGEPPVAAADDVLTSTKTPPARVDVLANDRDPDGGPLTLQCVRRAGRGRHGSRSPARTVTYRPLADSSGTDAFTYTVVDDRGNTSVATVTVKIQLIDDLPSPVADSITVPIGQTVTIHVLGNDIGLGDGLRLARDRRTAHEGDGPARGQRTRLHRDQADVVGQS